MKITRHFVLAALTIGAIAVGFGISDANATGKKYKKPMPKKPHTTAMNNKQSQGQGQGQHQGQGQSQTAKGGSAKASAGASANGGNSRNSNKLSNGQSSHNANKNSNKLSNGQSQSSTTGDNTNSLGQSADSSASNEGNNTNIDGDSVRNISVQLPPPVQAAAIPAATAACTTSNSRAFALGFNFVSWGTSDQIIDNLCMAERQAVAFERNCKFRSAIATRYWIAKQAAAANVVMQPRGNVDQGELYGGVPAAAMADTDTLNAFLVSIGGGAAQPWAHEVNYTATQCRAGVSAAPAPAPVLVESRMSSETYRRAQRYIADK